MSLSIDGFRVAEVWVDLQRVGVRNKGPKERVAEMIRIAHPDYRPMLEDYYKRSVAACSPSNCHTPHILEEETSWHIRARDTGKMTL